MLKWKVHPLKENGQIDFPLNELEIQKSKNEKVAIPELKNQSRRPQNQRISRNNDETSECEDESSCFGSDSSGFRDEIANLDDVLTTFKTSALFKDEEDSIITLKSSNLSYYDDSAFFESDSPLSHLKEEYSKDARSSLRSTRGYVADESDISSTFESKNHGKNKSFRKEFGLKANSSTIDSATTNHENCERDWDEVLLDETDIEEELKDLDYCVATSVDDTGSLSGFSTKSTDWEWKPRHVLHTLKEFCKKCKVDECKKDEEIPQTTETSPMKDVNISEIFSKTPDLSRSQQDETKLYQKKPVPLPRKVKPNSNKLTESVSNRNALVVQEESVYSEPYENFRCDERNPRTSNLSEINFNYGLRLNKFTFLPKGDKPVKPKDVKPEKRKSHFFVDDLESDLSCRKSWLDESSLTETTMMDCKAKLNKLFRSRSFSFSKMDLLSNFESKMSKSENKSTENSEKKKFKGIPKIPFPKGISKSLPKPKMSHRPSVVDYFKPRLKSVDIVDEAYVNLFPIENMSALHLAAEGRDYLMWCPDAEFDRAVASLDMRGLVELIHTLQDAMAVEQQTFESLSQQLEQVEDPLLQQRMSAALCTSQTRLARLCSRNMRCFTQQALKSRTRDLGPSSSLDSRASSPRDSGLAVSSSGSDYEGDYRGTSSTLPPLSSPPGGYNSHSFRSSLSFFQKAASIVSSNTKSLTVGGHRHRDNQKSSKRHTWQDDPNQAGPSARSRNTLPEGKSREDGRARSGVIKRDAESEDNETYEQVLFINGRPQFQNESSKRSRSYDHILDSRQSEHPNTEKTSVAVNTDPDVSKTDSTRSRRSARAAIKNEFSKTFPEEESPVDSGTPYRVGASLGNPVHSRSLGDVTTCVTLPRRKPVLNFGSVSDEVSDEYTSYSDDVNYSDYRGRSVNGVLNTGKGTTITRSRSFKEGLDFSDDTQTSSGLTRAQSLYDGLDAEDIINKKKINNAPSVDEILESVKSLRAQKSSMVKSSPDLLLQVSQEKAYHNSSRHKSSKGSSSKSSRKSSNNNGSSSSSSHGSSSQESKKEKSRKQNTDEGRYYEVDIPYYENIRHSGSQYENIAVKKIDVIYDCPKSSKIVGEIHDRCVDQQVDHYENVVFDPVYENVDENEPTYMNVSDNTKNKHTYNQDIIYANMDDVPQRPHRKHNRAGLLAISDDEFMYDVPKSITHIYDTPPKQNRRVPYNDAENEYDTPQNNRSVLCQSAKPALSSKTDQIKKIEDIFADCDKDSLDGDTADINGMGEPRIPPADYGSEEEEVSYRRRKSDVAPDYIDEGLGESDSRSYYADEQGLEVILEEPEDDYCSSHSSAEDLRRRLDLQLRIKEERRSLGSLEGSEGIGSAEGEEGDDSRSSGSSEGVGEDYCSSSGIHSEDTPSPGPPQDTTTKLSSSTSTEEGENSSRKEEDRTQKDRCVEIYPETIRQRQRNMAPSPSKVDIKNWEPSTESSEEDKKFLPSVKALRNQFENGKTKSSTNNNNLVRTPSDSSTNSLVMNSLDTSSGFGSLTSSQVTLEQSSTGPVPSTKDHEEESVEPIFSQFREVDDELKEMMSKPPSTHGWNPYSLLKRLYFVPDAPKIHRREAPFVNIEGYLEKLPSGRKKATFWNAWKRRYFVAKDGILYYYQNNQTEKPNMKLSLMGGKIEIMDPNMISVEDGGREPRNSGMLGIDDGKGHYVVVRCPSRQEAERWKHALETHTVDDFFSHYVQPWPRPTNPTLLRDTLVIDIGSCSVRAGVLTSQPTLPQLFFPSVVATNRETKSQVWGIDALMPDVRQTSVITFPIRPSHKISKFSVDLNSVSSLLQKTFNDLKVDPKNYNIQLSVPRVLNPHTQAELLKILFDKYGVKSVNMTHQSILALYAYNATSGIIVDIGERLDVVPVIDGYIVDGGVSRVPYGGYRILEHLRQFLFQKNISLLSEIDSYIIRQILENICYCAQHYNTEKQRCTMNPEKFEKIAPLSDFFPEDSQFDIFKNLPLDFGRFQATEGLFNPDAWGLDHPGLHKLVHKAIQECSMDIRKELSRSIFLCGGVTQLPGIADRLTAELDNLTPPAIRPKVHASPYRYHASYLGACILAESDAFAQSKITKEEWTKQGNSALRKWAL